jgi:hypothetical protein
MIGRHQLLTEDRVTTVTSERRQWICNDNFEVSHKVGKYAGGGVGGISEMGGKIR